MPNIKINQIRKFSKNRLFLVLISFVIIFSSGIFWDHAQAVVVESGPKLSQVGPTRDDNGFPLWYQDSKNVKLELCLEADDPNCGIVPEDFDPAKPISFPDNYPGEAFYQLAEASIEQGNVSALGTFALEATFNGGVPAKGDQTVFGRIRIRIDGLNPNSDYTITHPYGKDILTTDREGEINFTEDIGAGGGFSAALNSRIGTFLKWDSGAPEGYMGDPNVPHTITGGYNNQNYFRIEGPGIGSIETKEFSLAGKIAVNDGLDVQQATYNQTAEGGSIDVFVSSDVDQNIDISGAGIESTKLAGGKGQYFTRVAYTGVKPPASVTLTNKSDNPETKKTITNIVDRVTATANYDITTKTLTVIAKSSDEVDPPTLNVNGFGNIVPETGTLTVSNLSYIPPTITVTSANKGSVTIPVDINGTPLIPVVAIAGEDQSATAGEPGQITLNGSNSRGLIEAYSWEQLSGPTNIVLSGADTATAVFDTPSTPGEYIFQLTATGTSGTSTSTTKVTILDSEPNPDPGPDPEPGPTPITNAGPDQTNIKQGTTVTLDGSRSENATNYSWKQTKGTPVQLNSANTAKPTFTFPKKFESLIFELTTTGPNGTSTDTVEVFTVPDNITATSAEFRGRDNEWRIDGTSDIFGFGVKVTIKIFDSANPNGVVLGTADVDPLGNWRFRNTGLPIQTGGTLTIESSSGGKLTNVPVRIKAR